MRDVIVKTPTIDRRMLATILLAIAPALLQQDDRVRIRMDASQAAAVLEIVEKKKGGRPVDESDWSRLFATDPHRRLKLREESLGRSLADEDFRAFVLSDDLARRAGDLRRTLDAWQARDLASSARSVLGYLPASAQIRAAIHPVIKPQPNSFVFDVRGDPAIFLYLDPAQSPAEFENTVAHELHHIGFASVARSADSLQAGLSERARVATGWMAAFGEGFAMLAAAGGTDVHPHATSPTGVRERWDRDLANFAEDLRTLDAFFLDIIDGRLTSTDSIRTRAFSFFGIQGPWYTVGYRMAVVVERRYGRAVLIDCMLDPRRLLARYNAAAAEASAGGAPPPMWSGRLLDAIGTA
jgi:hypothetical protein